MSTSIDLGKLAFQVVHQILDIQPGQVAVISGEIHNAPNNSGMTNPLAEIPLVEEIALAVRKRGGFPVIELSTENLKHRFLREMPDDVYDQPLDYYRQWIGLVSCFIDIGWRSNPGLFLGLSDDRFKKLKRSAAALWDTILNSRKRLLFMGYPTIALADFYNVNYENLKELYFSGMNADYNKIRSLSERLRLKMKHIGQLLFRTAGGDLYLKLDHSMGNVINDTHPRLIFLPGGRFMAPIIPETAQGDLEAERVYYGHQRAERIRFHFEQGRITSIRPQKESSFTADLRKALQERKLRLTFQVGLNEQLSGYCGYHLYDTGILGNMSISTSDPEGREILFCNLEANVSTDSSESLLDFL